MTPSPLPANGPNANTADHDPPEPVAICGLACRLPAGISHPRHLWEFLLAGGDARSEVPASRYNVEAFYDPSGKPGTTKTRHGYFLDDELTNVDTSMVSMSRKELEKLDSQQRLMLNVARECFEDGGEVGWEGKKIGCYIGSLGEDWLEMLVQDTQSFGHYRVTGQADFSLSNRISYEMNLHGPRGDCESAIIGGTNLILRPHCTAQMSEQGVLSPDGSCKTFSSETNGYGRGEAIVGVFIKPLEQALRDGNSIRADAQEEVIRQAYQQAGLDMVDTGYFECHGTGTPLGDPIEAKAVANCFSKAGIIIGSTKSNFGHTEGASGLLSLLKAVLMLENKAIPPSIKFSPKNPRIPWDSGKLALAERPLSWPNDRVQRISVNSFGLGGSNAHTIIDSASNFRPITEKSSKKDETCQLLPYSAASQRSLNALISTYASFLEESSFNIADIAYTLARGREHLKHRSFAVVRGHSVITSPPATAPSHRTPKVVLVFTGQGAQWPGMAVELLMSNPTFQSAIRSLDEYLNASLGDDAPEWTIDEELRRPSETSRLGLAEFSQPLCTAVQIALIDTLRSVGIKADAIVGHSSGEIVGAYAAGALTAGEALVAALYRGVAAKKQTRPGAMAAIGMGVADAEKFLLPGACIACDNSPRSVTVSGDATSVEEVLSSIHKANPDTFARKLAVDKAYHSHHMAEIGDAYNALIQERIVAKPLEKPFFSSVEGKLLDASAKLDSQYWQKNAESPVLFNGAVTSLLRYFSDDEIILLEIGAHSALAGPLKQIMTDTSNKATYIPTLIRNQDAFESLLCSIGKLYASHVSTDIAALFPTGICLSNLPRYPHLPSDNSYWFESRLSREYRHRKFPHHDLLGTRILESTDIEPAWRNLFSWFEFSIVANSGSQWTKHCSGQVKAEGGPLANGISPESFPRVVKRERWFDAVRCQGLDLGHDFLHMDDITASTTTHEARCILSSRSYPLDTLSRYHIHPAVIDGILQLSSVAAANGLIRRHRNFLPVSCDQLLVTRTVKDFIASVGVSRMGRESTSSRFSNGKGILNGKVVLEFDGLEMRAAQVTGENEDKSDPHAASRLVWAADIDFVDVRSLFSPLPHIETYAKELDDLGRLSIQKIRKSLSHLTPKTLHHQQYADWIRSQPSSSESSEHDDEKIQRLTASLVNSEVGPVVQVLQAFMANIDTIVNGTPWESFLPSNIVASLCNTLSGVDSSAFFKTLGHSKPNLRTLEIGGWSRSPSNVIVDALQSNGRRFWSQYTFASTALLPAEKRLGHCEGVEFVTLDISKDLGEQGLEERQYDIVVVHGALQRLPIVEGSLRNIRQLLRPDGRLLLVGLGPAPDWTKLVLGTQTAWKNEELDQRALEGRKITDYWQQNLEIAGFGSLEAMTHDSRVGFESNGILLARPTNSLTNGVYKAFGLLVRDKLKSCHPIEERLQRHGYQVTKLTLKDNPPPNTDIISTLDLDSPFFENIADNDYEDFKTFLANLRNSGILWITKPWHTRVEDSRYAQVIGLARVIRTELLIDFATCEADDFDASLSLVCDVFDKFSNRDANDTLSPDFEFAIDEGIIKISRHLPFTLADNLLQSHDSERMKIVFENPGRWSSLQWERQAEPEPAALGNRAVEIEMHVVGLNFKDVLVGMNLIDHVGRYNGLEGAGVVRGVGSDVKAFKPGDRVVAMDHQMLSALVVTHENMCAKIPDSLEFLDAATMFTVFATVQQSLIKIGRLQRGESLLIHSACGGVGLAAVQIAQMIGAEIYATVGSNAKAQYLVDTFGIPRNRIFYSRDNSFVKDVYRETGGKGIDQVLNSLSGDLLHETWKCVAPHGKVIEIGKRGLLGHGKLDMEPFVANRSYCCVDIDAFYDHNSLRFKELMTETLEYLEKGSVKPIPIAKEFDASSIPNAFEHLLPGHHIGRVGIRICDVNGRLTMKTEACRSSAWNLELNSSGSYLLVGGLGGLGRAISIWMVEHGARNLTFFGRSAGKGEDDEAFIKELESMGVTVSTVRGSVTKLEDVARAFATAQPPLKGVLQLSTAQADDNFYAITKEQWDYSVGPKVTGTWNLHHATANLSLDFFVLASSLSAAVGMPGQANYASGNSFLDAFVQYRNNLGLPCSAINIGAVAGIVLLADKAALQRSAVLVGNKTVDEKELLDAMALAMTASIPRKPPSGSSDGQCSFTDPNVFVLGMASREPLESPSNRTVWKKDCRMAIYHNGDSNSEQATSSTDPLKVYLAQAQADPSILRTPEAGTFFAREIGSRLFDLLIKDGSELDIRVPLEDLGLDSLVAIELRAWCRQAFAVDVSVLEMLGVENLEMLGVLVAKKLVQATASRGEKE
ncbi:hypothetical protein M409DRAFT_68050 [Zasmidium cellare ATCC 36951]|uniref:Uncharacterized protein n=1 Tax=Zasmidium cellare ATCC 36951 TaxID=1080233 RepID=A0A6A6CD56_ZASCE|nr:uncharacterized protein M409DRAFT_68050 [Zasmidium cellare ATCC 36951]KAF2164140.1 hypothetical protein M409DRAFT_68050 [Zasmidium cellare ATCC 36951]